MGRAGGGGSRGGGLKQLFLTYIKDSRSALSAIFLILPLFMFYAWGIQYTGGVRNGVDLVSELVRQWPLAEQYYLHGLLGVMVLFLIVAFAVRKQSSFSPRFYPLIILEGMLYGVLLGYTVPRLLALLHIAPTFAPLAQAALGEIGALSVFDRVILSIGAGVWEELVFRLLLLGGLFLLLARGLKLARPLAWVVAIVISSLLFSGVHYIGNLADDFTLYSFLFRFFAGVIFATIFTLRGLAVAVYTHALYDIMVLVVLHG